MLSYDANDQLQQVTTRGMMPTTIATYRYDAIGRRIEKNVGGTITRYYYAGQQIVEERDGADSTQAFYTYGDYIDEPLTMDRGGARYYYQANRLYSTYLLTDTTGAIAERYTYTPYGVATTFTATYTTPQPTSRLGNPYLFTGRELDGETLLYYYRARTYDPVQGRFKQLDPTAIRAGEDSFSYASDRATTSVHRYGTFDWKIDSQNCTIELTVGVKLRFNHRDTGRTQLGFFDLWTVHVYEEWTSARQTAFQLAFKNQVEAAFNGKPFKLYPGRAGITINDMAASYAQGRFTGQAYCSCPCANGFSPSIRLAFDWWWPDFTIDVEANARRLFIRSSAELGGPHANLDEGDIYPANKGAPDAAVSRRA